MHVRGVEQRNQDICVEQCYHASADCLGFVAEPINNFRRDQQRPSLLGQNRHTVALAR